jgi:hypothetical protein
MRHVRLTPALLTGALLLGGAAADVARAAPASAASGWRPWGGTEIRSLDAPAARTSAAADDTPPPTGEPRPDTVLSDERTETRWANVATISAIRKRPDAGATRITSLRWYTEDGFPEVYLLLSSHYDASGREWIQVRIPMRPNGRVGWVRREALGRFHLTRVAVEVDRRHLRMRFYKDGRKIWSAPVGIGKRRTPTPPGRFWIRERFKVRDRSSGYWPYAFGTSDYSVLSDWPGGGVVGIHGPYGEANRIPGRISHGCIRLRKADTFWLARHVTIGTPVRILR